LQLVHEGDTLGFNLVSTDPDGDTTQCYLVYDEHTPAGVQFDGRTGYFEWTPPAGTVDNLQARDGLFTFTFAISDGNLRSTRQVQVKVLDVNQAPQIHASSHALLAGQTFRLPISRVGGKGLQINDADGAAQTAALSIAFDNLPEGAHLEGDSLVWTPGPAQLGDFVVTARVSDGYDVSSQTFTLRVVADNAANAPTALIDLTPSSPVVPGQTILATVRSHGYCDIASVRVQMRGAAIGAADWSDVALDGAGRVQLAAVAPGLAELRVQVVDVDGFSSTTSQTIRVRDPQDHAAPVLHWGGALDQGGRDAPPLTISEAITVQARIADVQLAGWQVQIARQGSQQWTTLPPLDRSGQAGSGLQDLVRLDPAGLANGVYQLRLSAWDVSGQVSELASQLVIDSSNKQLSQGSDSTARFQLGEHSVQLRRELPAQAGAASDFGNWQLPLLDTAISSDQPLRDAQGALAPWQDGARLWLRAPSLDGSSGPYLHFNFTPTKQALAGNAGAPVVWQAAFSSDSGWRLDAIDPSAQADGNALAPVWLQKVGNRLYEQASGLPWQPAGFCLTGPDGARYLLDTAGKLMAVRFSDGQQWLVDQNSIALLGDATQRISLLRDPLGRIEQISGPTAAAGQSSWVYRYDGQGRLMLARELYGSDKGQLYGYGNDGQLMNAPLDANLGEAANWLARSGATWQGHLQAGQTLRLGFMVRDSELASTIKVPGASGSLLLAVRSRANITLGASGATVVGSSVSQGQRTSLIRVSEAGLKLLTLQGEGDAELYLSVAGDLDGNGKVDAADSAAFEQALAGQAAVGDIDGDGVIASADRQLLFANYGYRAQSAPTVQALPTPVANTHSDLACRVDLGKLAASQGEPMFWRILGASHGSARLEADGQSLRFTPEPGFAGEASITVQADDGFASSAPVELKVAVSGAKLLALHAAPINGLQAGQAAQLQLSADFADARGVALDAAGLLAGGYVQIASESLRDIGYVGAAASAVSVDTAGIIHVRSAGAALLTISHTDASGHTVRTVTAFNTAAASAGADKGAADDVALPAAALDVYPGSLALVPGGSRQIKVNTAAGIAVAISQTNPHDVRFISSDDSIATVDTQGVIHALRAGHVTISVVHLANKTDWQGNVISQAIAQNDIDLHVEAARVIDGTAGRGVLVSASEGGAVSAATGETVLIGAGSLPADTPVSIARLDVNHVAETLGLPLPRPDLLTPLAAFRLDLGGQSCTAPLQLAIPLQNQGDLVAGDEVLFLKKGSVLGADGLPHDTWWVLDNGFIGADGIARTASKPFVGLANGGEVVIAGRHINAFTGEVKVSRRALVSFDGLSLDVSTGIPGTVGLIASLAISAFTIAEYTAAGVYQVQTVQKKLDGNGNIVLDIPPLPEGANPQDPQISGMEVLPGNQLKIKLSHALVDGIRASDTKFRVWLSPYDLDIDSQGNARDGDDWNGKALKRQGFRAWDNLGEAALDGDSLIVSYPAGVALSIHELTVQRITARQTSRGETSWVKSGAAATSLINGRSDFTAVAIGGELQIYDKNQALIHQEKFIDVDGDATDLGSRSKTDAIAFSLDKRLMFIAGKGGQIHVMDTATLKLVQSISLAGSSASLSALAVSGHWLYVAEGGDYQAKGGGRLMRINIDETDDDFLKNEEIVLPDDLKGEHARTGYRDLAVIEGAHSYLAVTCEERVFAREARKPGNVFVLDLDKLSRKGKALTAANDALCRVEFPNDKLTGNAPMYIESAGIADGKLRFMLTNSYDDNAGFCAVTVALQGAGQLGKAEVKKVVVNGVPQDKGMVASDRYRSRYQLNIQRARTPILVNQDGVEYALVADNYQVYNDPVYALTDWFDGKIWGSKIGVIKDPFGKAEYLGSTTPLYGTITRAALSADGQSLLADFRDWAYIQTGDAEESGHLLKWKLSDLIKAANEHSIKKQDTRHPLPFDVVKVDDETQAVLTATKLPLPSLDGNTPAWVVGMATSSVLTPTDITFTDPANPEHLLTAGDTPVPIPPVGKVVPSANYGDILRVDLIALLRQEHPALRLLEDADFNFNNTMKFDSRGGATILAKENGEFLTAERDKTAQGPSIVAASAKTYPGLDGQNQRELLQKSGVIFIAPGVDSEVLRNGDRLKDNYLFLNLNRDLIKPSGIEKIKRAIKNGGPLTGDPKYDASTLDYLKLISPQTSVQVQIKLTDFKSSTDRKFFGDRPLDDPGYHAFELGGTVGLGQTNKLLDVWRVQQRLAYLGYPAFDPANANQAKDFDVDGKFNADDQSALKLFEKVIRYGQGDGSEKTVRGSYPVVKASIPGDQNFLVSMTVDYYADSTSPTGYTSKWSEPVFTPTTRGRRLSAADQTAQKATLRSQVTDRNGDFFKGLEEMARQDYVKKYNDAIDKTRHFNTNSADSDGVLDAKDLNTADQTRINTLSWLNAYNAPHWMQLFKKEAGTGQAASATPVYSPVNHDLEGWKGADGGVSNQFGTSWVYDLMVASSGAMKGGDAKQQRGAEKLQFAGAGELGMMLNLGINKNYVSKPNQDRIDGDQVLFGLYNKFSPDITRLLKGNSWNFDSALKLSDLLKNANRTNANWLKANNETLSTSRQGVDDEGSALRDFLSVYTATQKDGTSDNGSWDELKITGTGNQDTIRKALFGDGTQNGGLIDRNGVLLGGLGTNGVSFSDKLTAASLGKMMQSKVSLIDWVDPINSAMTDFEINTPKRLAAFLANVWGETGGLAKLSENTNWNLYAMKNGAYSQRFVKFKTADAATIAAYDDKSADDKADYAYHSTNVHDVAYNMGNTETDDGHKYKGRGLLHLTWKANYQAASRGLNAVYGEGTYDLEKNWQSVSDDRLVAARTGTWFWRHSLHRDANAIVDHGAWDDLGVFRSSVIAVRNGADPQRDTHWQEIVKPFVYAGNSYGNMGEVLKALGVQTSNGRGYNGQFGIALNHRIAQAIGSARLEAKDGVPQSSVDLTGLQAEFEVSPGETDMLFVAMPNVPPQPVQMVAQVQPKIPVKGQVYGTVGVCFPFLNTGLIEEQRIQNGSYSLGVAAEAINVFGWNLPQGFPNIDYHNAKIATLQAPKHGKLGDQPYVGFDFSYYPDKGYQGTDKVVFLVDIEGYQVKVVYYIKVVLGKDYAKFSNDFGKYCPSPSAWQISSAAAESFARQMTSIGWALDLSPLTVSDLSLGALGQTTGIGPSAQITLDYNAAGHGWYVDADPSDSSDFLPTADPTVWLARPGSAADGKMDLLSVLLHEYGHALGFEHSPDAADYMAATVKPGERRLPSADELGLMRTLLAQLSGSDSASAAAVNPASNIPTQPSAPTAPLPPVGMLAGLLAIGRLRANRGGELGLLKDGLQLGAAPQRSTVLNPTLASVATPTAWQRDGAVSLPDSPLPTAAQATMLAESASGSAHLSQAFEIGTADRYLAFTVDQDLQDNLDHGPNDAFEVALLNANTGASLVGSDGFDHSDALLNLQREVQGLVEHRANAVRAMRNADGSTTYYVDLQHGLDGKTLAGTPAVLSFDLLGFGDAGSHISLRDIHLVQTPQAFDQPVLAQEDHSINVAPQTIDAHLPSSALAVVSQPAHGTVSVNPDGTFSYTPATHYYGADSFQYQYTVDGQTSNIATVSLQVSEVAYAPVVPSGSLSATVTAGKAYSFDPLAGAVDINGHAMHAVIDQQPAHGQLLTNPDGSWTYTADSQYSGGDSLVYHLNDGLADSAPVTVNFTVQPAHHAPVANGGAVQLKEDGSLVIDLRQFGNDPDGNAMTATVTAQPSHGSLVQNSDGTFTYTPKLHYYGADSLRFTLADAFLGSQEATLDIDVAKIEIAPTLADSSLGLDEFGSVTFNPLAQANSANGDPLTARLVNDPQHGTLRVNTDGSWTYTPNGNFYGTDSLTYKVSDGVADSTIATLTFNVAKQEIAPTLDGQTISLDEDSLATIQPLRGATDLNGDPLTARIVSQPAHGTLTVNADGSFAYTAALAYNGADSFSYVVNDGTVDSNIATVSITITSSNHAPTAVDSLAVGSEDSALVLTWRDFAVADVDGDALSITLNALPIDGLLQKQITGNDGKPQWIAASVGDRFNQADIDAGKLRFIPAANASGGAGYALAGYGNQHQHYAKLAYTVSDGKLSASAVVNLDIAAVADAPTVTLGATQSSQTLFTTGWEAAPASSNGQSVLVGGSLFDGWKLITEGDQLYGGQNGFEIWHNGDAMQAANGYSYSVNAAAGNGSRFLELNDAAGSQYQTLGISRQIDTRAGERYDLSFDLAGRLGFDGD
ncbi:Ig-like domain-containing protein, partial [Chitinimonas sp.]|uniref:Ig-like domain-containing protein n=1 Tax=Chitinimonas sp. TaxID=1934313 RepID=UPI0035AF2D10